MAVARATLAVMFALWVWIAPDQPARLHLLGYALMAGYIAFTLFVLRAAWQDWWVDFHLARITFAIDAATFLIAILFTQNSEAEFFSPYFSFFAFLMLSAVLRWNWPSAVLVGIALCLGFLVTTWLLSLSGMELELAKLLRRVSYMAVVSLMVVWLAVRRGGVTLDLTDLPDPGSVELAPANALHWAMASTRASGGALVWQSHDEPHGVLQRAGTLGNRQDILSPTDATLSDDFAPALFDLARRRALVGAPDGTVAAMAQVDPPALLARLGLGEALVLPLNGDEGRGALILSGVPGLTRDDLSMGQAIAAEAGRVIDRAKALEDSRIAMAARIRSNLARDLHDSVVQSLAGTGFRLAALRSRIAAGEQPLAEIDAISAGLQGEQAQLRQMIESLRRDQPMRTTADLAAALAELVPNLARQWGIEVVLQPVAGAFPVPTARLYDCLQIVREAVANAVRHGKADEVTVALADRGGRYCLTITDNGTGFADSALDQPRSITERAAAMQARLTIETQAGHTRITIDQIAGERA